MLNLNDREWKEFFLSGNYGVFDIKATKSGIDKNKLLDNADKSVPYITRSENQNGINLFVSERQQSKYSKDEGNCITIGLDTQTVFYQPYSFYTGQNIQVLRSDKITKEIALFICSMIKVQMEHFNWGGNGATLGRLSRTKIMLPITSDNKPDYEFMKLYIRQQYDAKKTSYVMHCQKQLFKLGEIVQLPSFSEKEWKVYFIKDVFDKVKRGKRLKKADHIDGDIPYVSSTAFNNGVDQFIGNGEKVRVYCDCLSLANSGSVGSCFYEPFNFVASDHVTHLKNEKMNQFHYLFIATMLRRLSQKYNFNREISDKRIEREKILLPVTEYGEPDYDYMEQYSKNLMIKKYRQYLDYLGVEY